MNYVILCASWNSRNIYIGESLPKQFQKLSLVFIMVLFYFKIDTTARRQSTILQGLLDEQVYNPLNQTKLNVQEWRTFKY